MYFCVIRLPVSTFTTIVLPCVYLQLSLMKEATTVTSDISAENKDTSSKAHEVTGKTTEEFTTALSHNMVIMLVSFVCVMNFLSTCKPVTLVTTKLS